MSASTVTPKRPRTSIGFARHGVAWRLSAIALIVLPPACSDDEEPNDEARGGTSGNAGRGGAGGSGGGTGGSAGAAGTPADAGAAGDQGDAGGGGAGSGQSGAAGEDSGGAGAGDCDSSDAGCGGESACSIDVLSATIAPNIATVGVIEFSTDLPKAAIDGASIEFGPSGMTPLEAPVDLDEPNYRTLLLGMPPATTFDYRVVITADSIRCEATGRLTTGNLPVGSPSNATVTTGPSSAPAERGFIISSNYVGDWIYILNDAGRVVWAYAVTSNDPIGVSRAQLSHDGKHMYARELNVQASASFGHLYRIAMDGSTVESTLLATSHHDFVVMPDSSIVYLSKEGGTGPASEPCDAIRRRSADGTDELVYDLWDALSGFATDPGASDLCHATAVRYDAAEDAFTVGELNRDVFVKVSAEGELIWTLGGSAGDFTGDVVWDRQYGHQTLGAGHFLFFNNGAVATTGDSQVIELDLTGTTATEVWRYDANLYSAVLGDVQRLAGGNTLVTYSRARVLHEVDPDRVLVRSFTLTADSGYSQQRRSLYPTP